MNEKTVNRHIASGAIWMLLMRAVIKGIGLVSTMILARLLVPDDFGLMAIAGSVYAFIDLIRAFGFDTVLIQKQNARPDHYSTAWTLQLSFALFSAMLICVVAPMAANFYDDSRLENILFALAFITFVSGLENIGIVEFRKKFDFNKEFKFNVIGKIVGFCATVVSAYIIRSYWALIIGMLANRVALLASSYLMQEFRPKLTFIEWRSLFSFSIWLQINNVLMFLYMHSQNFILGKTLGQTSLGHFSIGYEIATLAPTEIVAPINRAAYPGYAKVSKNIQELAATYLKVLSTIALIAAPCALGISAVAPWLVPVFLGQGWDESVEVIQWVSAASLLIAMNSNAGYLYLSLARQKLTSLLLLIRVLILVPLLLLMSQSSGLLGAAQAFAITACIMFPVSLFFVRQFTGVSIFRIFGAILSPITSSIVMWLIIHGVARHIASAFPSISSPLMLILLLVVGAVSYIGCIFLIWKLRGSKMGIETDLFEYAKISITKLFKPT